jgi:hypothetical protein
MSLKAKTKRIKRLDKHKKYNIHINKYSKFSKAKPIKATPLHRRARNVQH